MRASPCLKCLKLCLKTFLAIGLFSQIGSVIKTSRFRGRKKSLNIRYRKVDDTTRPEGHWFYPLLQVFIRNGINMQPVLALVDSGAADCIFSASLGEVLGIDVPSGRPHQFHAFDFQETKGFVHNVQLQVPGFSHWVDLNAVFIESEVMAILGQQGFFENYQVASNDLGANSRSTLKKTPCYGINGGTVPGAFEDAKRRTWF